MERYKQYMALFTAKLAEKDAIILNLLDAVMRLEDGSFETDSVVANAMLDAVKYLLEHE